jgi:integrase
VRDQWRHHRCAYQAYADQSPRHRKASRYPIVAVAAFTGARRNEILALRWSDLDSVEKTLRIERALEETKGEPGKGPTRRLKEPKRANHKRTIQIDDALIALLLSERDKHLRLVAGVPDGAAVLVKLPPDALMFPSFAGRELDLTRLRDAHSVTQEFEKQARKRFPSLRFHDLRGSHETVLLDKGFPSTSSRLVVVMMQQCCYAPTPSGPAKRIAARPASSATSRRPLWERTENNLGPNWVQNPNRSVNVRPGYSPKPLFKLSTPDRPK